MTARPRHRLETRIGRLLGAGTRAAVGLLAVGTLLLLVGGASPLDAAPAFDVGRLAGDLAALQPAGLLWLGLAVVIATPVGRVAAALIGYLATRERAMAAISALILLVIGAGVVAGMAGA
jgi:uncharacterized membrane protein